METNQLFNSFTELYRPYIKQVQPLLDKYHLHTAQFLVLKDIYLHAPTTLVEISKRRSIEKPSTRKLLKVLHEFDLLTVTPGEDKRQKLLGLTDKGNTIYHEVMEQVTAFQQNSIKAAGISQEDMECTIKTLQSLKNIL
ncbi:winged helix DNA-binding protein [Staphylococcus sp. EZ-P03]|uniref:MarR family winged helix-turn-helix transcriptional regulator n=1 Tax=Staphylococcus sp. EZ-P03 TaxID=2282739 RepID=UPI000DF82EA9|nr:winged helix DNA-binding protein [Staphylococcus sp. EZ-P03]